MRCALIVSANRYRHYRSLRYCHTDGHLLSQTLTDLCDYDRQGPVRHVRLDRQPGYDSPDALLSAIRALAADDRTIDVPGEQNTFLFYFAGHGLFDEETRTSYLLLPGSRPDALADTALSIRELRAALTELGRPIVQILDACHSGEGFRGRGDAAPADPSVAPNVRGFVTDLRRNVDHAGESSRAGWEMLAACDEDQSSYELDDLQHGIFTHSLVNALRHTPPGGDVLLASLKDTVCQEVRAWAEQHGCVQNPVFAARTFGRHLLTRRNHRPVLVPRPRARPVDPDSDRVRRHCVNLPARQRAEVDLGAYLTPSRLLTGRHLRLRVDFERDDLQFELDATPEVIRGGRRVPRPIFNLGPNLNITAGPYDWNEQRLRLRFNERQAIVTSVDIDGNQVIVTVNIP